MNAEQLAELVKSRWEEEKLAEEYFITQTKEAGPRMQAMGDAFGRTGSHLGDAALNAGVGAVAVSGISAIGMAAEKIYGAMTKQRDFKSMLGENPDVMEAHQQNPKLINSYYSSLRSFAPHFSSDPMVAGHFMRGMIQNPGAAAGQIVSALEMHGNLPINPVTDAFHRGALEGGKAGITEGLKNRGQQAADARRFQQEETMAKRQELHQTGLETKRQTFQKDEREQGQSFQTSERVQGGTDKHEYDRKLERFRDALKAKADIRKARDGDRDRGPRGPGDFY